MSLRAGTASLPLERPPIEAEGGPLRSGWLKKRSPTWPHPWQRRYFQLDQQQVAYFHREGDDKSAGSIPLRDISSVTSNESLLSITVRSQQSPERVYQLLAGTSSDRSYAIEAEQWQHAILTAREAALLKSW